MAIKKITMQDIADKCGLSRNTVSKIFNQRGNVPEETRMLVYKAAAELGYRQPLEPILSGPGMAAPLDTSLSIAVLSQNNPMHHAFGFSFIKSFTDQICRMGYTVRMYEVSAEEMQKRILPPNISLENTAGILCIELFDIQYLNTICDLGLPTILVDGYKDIILSMLPCDVITMENIAVSAELTRSMINAGAGSVGFVGDPNHCNSFNERFKGFSLALAEAGIALDRSICILDSDNNPYGDLDWIEDKFNKMPYLPDAFVCANDFHALHIMAALKRRGLSVPKDVMVTGFDNSPESAIVEPGLTTAQIASSEMGVRAADILAERIRNPQHSYCLTYVQSQPIFRDSIGDGGF